MGAKRNPPQFRAKVMWKPERPVTPADVARLQRKLAEAVRDREPEEVIERAEQKLADALSMSK